MTIEVQNMEMIKRFFDEVWNNGREEAIDELYVVGGEAHGLGEDFKNGPEAFKQFHQLIHATCTDIRVVIGDMLAAGDRVAIRASVYLTHKATGKALVLNGGGFMTVANGQIVQAWNGRDFLGMLAQLGTLPENALVHSLSIEQKEKPAGLKARRV